MAGKNRSPIVTILSVSSISGIMVFCIFTTLMVTAVYFAIEQLPFGSLKPAAKAWMLGTPQANLYDEYEVYGDGHGGSDGGGEGEDPEAEYTELRHSGIITVGELVYDGYEGPTSFYCGDLFVQEDGSYSRISDCYGTERRDTNTGELLLPHMGIDFGVDQGVPIRAVMGGKVVYAGIYGGWGYSIVVENQGVQVLYGHATNLLLDGEIAQPEDIVGEIIDAGDVIMTVGGGNGDDRDGSSTGPHLHFEVRLCQENYLGNITCSFAADPLGVVFPGETEVCNWYATVNNPERNDPCTGLE